MPYIIETWDKPGHRALRAHVRAEHLVYLDNNSSRLLACGAKLEDDGTDLGGGLYILDTERRSDAEQFISADPFSTAGLFDRITITRWRKAYLDSKCFLPNTDTSTSATPADSGGL
ncbi:hypothetical protein B7R21_16665 [Subtercola boreus]|uniref:YCII-related domain-containing protein n=1 Tax=Subtercola boreus TaxID=120213 RepID=A0A3E0VB54_9MICO|nr:YciI family protein [Subtercola boreus]RFA07092.1 hypothetical protein B7R21_16665 [Subtercola boreus]